MLWYKSWLDTRLRFFIGLALLACSAAAVVFAYPRVLQLMPMADGAEVGGELGRQIREGIALAREYRGYVWSQWFGKSVLQMWTLFAVLLGSGSLLTHGSGGSLFTLALPTRRGRIVWTRGALGLGEMLVLAVIPSLVIPLLSPAVGESYTVGTALVHAVCLFVGGAVFFCLALLLSTVFTDVWRPLLIALAAAIVIGLCESVLRDVSPYGLFRVMTAETYFRTGHLPWTGLLVSASASAALLFGAAGNFERRDF